VTRKKKRWKKKDADFHTCEKVFIGFSNECLKADEEALTNEFKFRISDHGDYFCIIPGLAKDHPQYDGTHPCSADQDGNPWKVTALGQKALRTKSGWSGKYLKKEIGVTQNEFFSLRLYGCDECDTLEKYFKFQEGTNKLIYGKFREEEGNQQAKEIFWNENQSNLWNQKKLGDQNNFLANAVSGEESTCDCPPADKASAYEAFLAKVKNPDSTESSYEPEFSAPEGTTFIITDPTEKAFVAAFRVPFNECNQVSGQVNFRIRIYKNKSTTPPTYIVDQYVHKNCANSGTLTQFEDVFISEFNSFNLIGDDVWPEIKNNGVLASLPGENKVDFYVLNYAPENLEWYSIDYDADGILVPEHVSTIEPY